jgi:two-component system cell cycle sensor histidine kinase/response regulator CckA
MPSVNPETILVVDDSGDIRNLVVALLERAGFRVLSADGGDNAIKLASETKTPIDLLLSDVDMPGMSGPDLGEVLKKARPDLRVMLMSGGTNGSLLVLNYGWAFIQKPFVAGKLVQMITEVLHSENRSQPGGQEFDSRKDRKSLSPEKSAACTAGIHPPTSNEPRDRGTEK